MKLFHETSIKLYSKKSNLKICVISDIHFSYRVTNKKLDALTKKLEERHPSYIFLPGDLVDSNNMVEKESEKNRLLAWLEKLGEFTTVLISEGNHDTYKKHKKTEKKETGDKFSVVKNTTLINNINSLKNVHYLDNSIYEDKNIYVLGLSLPEEYYGLTKKAKTDNASSGENIDVLLKTLDNIDQKLITNLPKNKLKFALIHSPCFLSDFRVKAELADFDYLISGHMHNGLVPPIVDELWRSDRGLVNATQRVGSKNTRLSRKTLANGLIITGAVTTWHECTGVFHKLNALYPSYFTTLEYVKDEQYKKPYVKKKYLNY